MSQINFAALSDDRPDLQQVWNRFSAWVEDHPNRRIIDPRALARNLRDISALELVDACHVLVEHGMLRQAFMVESQSGQLVGEPYRSPNDIPAQMHGTFEEWINTADANVVAVFIVGVIDE